MMYLALYIGLYCIFGYQVLKLVWVYWIRRPVSARGPHVYLRLRYLQDSDVVAGLPTIFGKWLTSILCLVQGPEVLAKTYRKVGTMESYDDSALILINRLLASPLPFRL